MKKTILALFIVLLIVALSGCAEQDADLSESSVPETQPETPIRVNSVSLSQEAQTYDTLKKSDSFYYDMFLGDLQERHRYFITTDGVTFAGILMAVSDSHIILDSDESSVYIISIDSIDSVMDANTSTYKSNEWMQRHGFTTGPHYEIFKKKYV